MQYEQALEKMKDGYKMSLPSLNGFFTYDTFHETVVFHPWSWSQNNKPEFTDSTDMGSPLEIESDKWEIAVIL